MNLPMTFVSKFKGEGKTIIWKSGKYHDYQKILDVLLMTCTDGFPRIFTTFNESYYLKVKNQIFLCMSLIMSTRRD